MCALKAVVQPIGPLGSCPATGHVVEGHVAEGLLIEDLLIEDLLAGCLFAA
jgi:hypothetical protein